MAGDSVAVRYTWLTIREFRQLCLISYIIALLTAFSFQIEFDACLFLSNEYFEVYLFSLQ